MCKYVYLQNIKHDGLMQLKNKWASLVGIWSPKKYSVLPRPLDLCTHTCMDYLSLVRPTIVELEIKTDIDFYVLVCAYK